jgi:hypothetical protein
MASEQMHDSVREAKQAGMPIAEIARETGLSRQGVYDLLNGQPPS